MTTGERSSAQAGPKPISILKCPKCGASNKIRPSERGAPHCGTCGTALPWVVDASEATFEVEAKAAPIVIIDLWAPWCGPCRFVSPLLDQFAHEHAGRVKVVKVNVDDNQRLAVRFDATSIPTMVILRDGQIVDRIVGAMPQPALWARLTPHLKPPKTA